MTIQLIFATFGVPFIIGFLGRLAFTEERFSSVRRAGYWLGLSILAGALFGVASALAFASCTLLGYLLTATACFFLKKLRQPAVLSLGEPTFLIGYDDQGRPITRSAHSQRGTGLRLSV